MRHSGGPRISFREGPSASTFIKEWTRPKNGTRALEAVFAIGVRQQSAYQRKTLFEKRRLRTASIPAVSFTRPGGICTMSVPPAASSTSARSRKRAKTLTILAVADEAEAAGGREFARSAAHAAAPTLQREIEGHACHIHAGDHEIRTANSLGLLSLERRRGLAEGRNRRTTDLEKMADWCLGRSHAPRASKKSPAENRGAFV